MSFYVKIDKLNGRHDHLELGAWLNQSGVGAVDYHEGGWEDKCVRNVHPHLKFENGEDAAAYVLTYGGVVLKSIPEREPGVDYYPGG